MKKTPYTQIQKDPQAYEIRHSPFPAQPGYFPGFMLGLFWQAVFLEFGQPPGQQPERVLAHHQPRLA